MIRPALLLSAACIFNCTALSQISARAAAPVLSAPASSAPADSEASEAAAPAARHLFYHRRSRHSSSSRSLPSRGIVSSSEAAAQSVVGRLAQVTSDKAVIVAGREASGRVLSVCPKGQYLAISGQTPTQYAVLMVDHSVGFVSKSDVELLNCQVANATPDSGSADSSGSASAQVGPLGQALVQTSFGYLGVHYVWGGTTAAGIDCSGFVRAVYAAHSLSLPRVSGDQATVGYDVPRGDWSKWVPGDRMYFACHHDRIDHTGMYIGGGRFIHSSMGHGQSVAIDRVDGAYYAQHLVCVRRSRELLGDMPAPGQVSQTASAGASPSADAESSQF